MQAPHYVHSKCVVFWQGEWMRITRYGTLKKKYYKREIFFLKKLNQQTVHHMEGYHRDFYLPHMEYEGSIGLATGKMKKFFCLFSLFRTFYD
jgi:hypothetical protein